MVVFESAASVAAALDAARDGQIVELAGFDEGGEEGGGQGQAGPGPSSTAEGLRGAACWRGGQAMSAPSHASILYRAMTAHTPVDTEHPLLPPLPRSVGERA